MITKSLKAILRNNPFIDDEVDVDFEISQVTANSSLCKTGSLFVATRGALPTSKDGHDFIDQAILNGASAVVFEDESLTQKYPIPMIRARDSKAALCHLCEDFYERPSRKISVIGITGTSGKTSTSFMLHSILKTAGFIPKVMGSLGMGDPGSLKPLSHTTMDPEFISQALASMHEDGASHAIMEISSHALSLKRVEALNFRAVALTNITQDHLDFHGTIEAYTKAKSRLFFELAHDDTAVVLPKNHPFLPLKKAMSVGDIIPDSANTFTLMREEKPPLKIALPYSGDFHMKNAALAVALAESLGISDEHIEVGLKNAPSIPGRLQWIENRRGLKVVVDFAHKPDALLNLLTTIKKSSGRIILVFGCGGDRDQKKRPLMGEIASSLADFAIVTDDNPRTEDPQAIRRDILSGMKMNAHALEISDRRVAIRTAIGMAQKNDTVVIAGKGDENYQIYENIKTPFSDPVEAKRALEEL